jgi:hypothetical protein
MTPRKSAIKTDLFAADFHQQKLDQLGDPLLRIASCIDFPALADSLLEINAVAVPPVHDEQHDDVPASLLALFTLGAMSIHGFWSKKPVGISLKPVVMQGCTGKSSMRG